jgi:hypothetical protein
MGSPAKLNVTGLASGLALAPLAALGSYLRHARVFHPSGICMRGVALPIAGAERFHDAGERLAGPVLARFSGAWWKSRQWPDVLGCALRFSNHDALAAAPHATDQDLLLATVRHPLTTLLAPLSTNVDDYLGNAYFGVSPFRVRSIGRVKLRLCSLETSPMSGTREQRLKRALSRAPVRLMLEARPDRLATRYQAVARIELVEAVEIDQRTLRFDPFANGRGFVPVGLVHAMRIATYAASRRARGAMA